MFLVLTSRANPSDQAAGNHLMASSGLLNNPHQLLEPDYGGAYDFM